jgi:hypothetical protein
MKKYERLAKARCAEVARIKAGIEDIERKRRTCIAAHERGKLAPYNIDALQIKLEGLCAEIDAIQSWLEIQYQNVPSDFQHTAEQGKRRFWQLVGGKPNFRR